jgi:hypothetical protein
MKQMIESGRTDQEKQAIETTITIIERYLSSNDKYSILSGATKQLPEIATAYRALNHSASSLFLGVLQRLENAVGACATEEEASAAHEAMGLMSDEEVQNAKEMISKMSINGSSTNNDARP